MDIGSMDVEDFQRRWQRAKRAWDEVRQAKLRKDVAGEVLSDDERARWNAARAEFQAVEDLWDQAYRAGVIIVVGDEDDDPDPGDPR